MEHYVINSDTTKGRNITHIEGKNITKMKLFWIRTFPPFYLGHFLLDFNKMSNERTALSKQTVHFSFLQLQDIQQSQLLLN